MNITSSYTIEILKANHIFDATTKIYRNAISYCTERINSKWEEISLIEDVKRRFNYAEKLLHRTKSNINPCFDFDKQFPKFPSYLRRDVIQRSIGIVKSYRTNLTNWEQNDRKGASPKLGIDHKLYPCFYNKQMYMKSEDPYVVYLKLYRNNDWVWVPVSLCHTDIKYLQKYWSLVTPSAPTLEKRYGKYYLRFAFKESVELNKTAVNNQTICSVDLGLNTDAVCSIMRSDGTILARKFINFPSEKDHLYTVLNRIKKFQRKHSSKNVTSFWAYARRLNDELAKKIANEITSFACENEAHVIVFEHLDFKGKRKGSKKQRLHMWRKNGIQTLVEHKAHRCGIRISRICAWGTSRLAFDGSGPLTRDENNHALATFSSGKRYNCDLSASYNIGARYFIRELLKPVSATKRSSLEAKVPPATRRTLSTLLELNALLKVKKAA